MASLVPCPHCGPRPRQEFTIKGAALQRPTADADAEEWFDYVYLRDNPRGWLIVARDTVTHEISACRDAAGEKEVTSA